MLFLVITRKNFKISSNLDVHEAVVQIYIGGPSTCRFTGLGVDKFKTVDIFS